MLFELFLGFCGAAIIVLVVDFYKNKINKEHIISLKESVDLANVPIVTFQIGNNKLNFLLDSGSSESHISNSAFELLNIEAQDTNYSCTGASGSASSSKVLEVPLLYKKETFNVKLYVTPSLDESFTVVKKNCGVQVHGILGTDFLETHKYILDFAELIAYHK